MTKEAVEPRKWLDKCLHVLKCSAGQVSRMSRVCRVCRVCDLLNANDKFMQNFSALKCH